MQSYWLSSDPDTKKYSHATTTVSADVIVIGGGIAGTIACEELLRSGKKVILLEKNHCATGDTAATTGFLTRVPDTSLDEVIKKYGENFARDLCNATHEMQQRLFSLIKEKNIACDFQMCTSFFGAYSKNDVHIARESNVYARVMPYAARAEEGCGFFQEAVAFMHEGKINARRFVSNLLEKLIHQYHNQFFIYEETEATEISVNSDGVTILTPHAVIKGCSVILSVGDPSYLFPELENIFERRVSYVIAAEFEKDSPLLPDMYWDVLDPYFYYRFVDNKTLIVGGSDIAVDKIKLQSPYEKLETFLKEHTTAAFNVTHRWSGSIFHTNDGLPYSFEHPQYAGKVFIATGFGGNGLVMGSLCGFLAAQKACGTLNATQALFDISRTKLKILKRNAQESLKNSQVAEWVIAGDIHEFEKRSMLCKKINGTKILMVKDGESYYAMDNTCSHAGGSLCDGILEGEFVECPLHAARFNIKTGAVVSPPATRGQKIYAVRVQGTILEIQMQHTQQQEKKIISPVDTPKKYWGLLLKCSGLGFLFLGLEFALQYFYLIKGDFPASLMRSTALAGSTLFGAALFSSALFRWIPRMAIHWRIRRYLGVIGFVFIAVHALSVFYYFFNFDLKAIYYSFNPFENPIIFGSFAFPIFMILALTSTDWAVTKLTPKIWKNIHRLVYVGYISSIFHFILINPTLLNNGAGYILLAVTGAALFGQVFWYFKMAKRRHFKSLSSLIGALIIITAITMAYYAYVTI